MKKLKIEDLRISSFTTESKTVAPIGIDPFCCTGCDSGCGINPTAVGCESGGYETKNCW